jgi:maleylacetate reductase
MNAIAHCVEAFWADGRTPVTMALASEALRRFAKSLPAVVGDGADHDARAECLIAAWLAGTVLAAGTGLHHKLAHVLGGLGLPHAETHAIILPHVTRFNLQAAPEAKARLAEALDGDDPAAALAAMLKQFPIPQRLREVGFDAGKIDFVAGEVAAAGIKSPRRPTAAEVRKLLIAAH